MTYEELEMEVISFDDDDVIVTSRCVHLPFVPVRPNNNGCNIYTEE